MSQPYVGEIRMFGGNFAPLGWDFCNGQLLAIAEDETLFNLIGTTYGGDGQSTFALPNLQSRVPVHQGGAFSLGETAGEETVTLTTAQIPVHSHVAQATSDGGSATSPANGVWAQSPQLAYSQPPNVATTMGSDNVRLVGGSQPHDNLLPYLAISFIISLYGVYPSQ
jgi:microcystin-dependent protein